MVKYYGRARQRIGSVNTNQIGLKMSGCPSKVGRKGTIDRYISRRSQCNQKYCGPVYYHGVIWSWNSGRCVAKAPRGQSFNSGVGHKSTPRFACGNTCETGLDALAAVRILKEYFKSKYGKKGLGLILVAKKETLTSDKVNHPQKFEPVQHFYPGTPEYANLPLDIKQAVDVVNALQIEGSLKPGGPPVVHVVGAADLQARGELLAEGYGVKVQFGPETFVNKFSYGSQLLDLALGCGLAVTATAISGFIYCSTVSAIIAAPTAETGLPLGISFCAGTILGISEGVALVCFIAACAEALST